MKTRNAILALILGMATTACGSATESTQAEVAADRIVKIEISDHQTFNDTDGDGYGEFEGWGTSLCWWANRVGYSDELTERSAKLFFDPDNGLGLNIGRYNIGGGDNVTDKPLAEVSDPSDFLHEEHIKRSDSIVPGYATDVTKIDLSAQSKEYYEQNFAQADFDCGYAWNYDWEADRNQINVLKAAAKSAGSEFIAEAFSNSPPYFMTESGCSSGNRKAAVDNLRKDSYKAFACYMADVIQHLSDSG